jgi:hypothetical protein
MPAVIRVLARRLLAPALIASFAALALPASAGAVTQTFNFSGHTDTFTVPTAVSEITVDATGAQGGAGHGNPGGKGAHLIATFPVSSGEILNVLAGGAGVTQTGAGGGGGGGGSFVYRSATAGGLLLAAAGGGGGGFISPGIDASATTTAAAGGGGGPAGTGGNGGGGGGTFSPGGGGGGGLLTDGGDGIGGGGKSLANGGAGGTPGNAGGFGGGGAGAGGGGGGGGYNGGGGGATPGGGGGGSFSTTTPTTAQSGSNTGDGQVMITYALAPMVATNASPGIAIGGQVHDSATLTGGQSPGGSIAFNLYGPDDSNCSAPPVFTDTQTLSGGGATSTDFTPTAPGVYRWTASYAGDANNDPASSACNAANESVTVSQSAPLLSTIASPNVEIGDSVDDVATLSQGVNPTGTITFSLYGPDDSGCSGAAAFTDTQTVSGNGQYTSGQFTPTAAGTYRWIASYSGDSDNSAAQTACNEGSESVTVTAPAVTKLKLDPDVFTAELKPTPLGPPTPKRSSGTDIRFSLSASALVHFSIRHVPGHPNPSGPKVPHAFNRLFVAGKQSVHFTGTLDHHTLHPGNYKLYVRAIETSSGYRSPKVSAKFTVLGG